MNDNKLLNKIRVRDVVRDVYNEYVMKEIEKYGDKVDEIYLSEEITLLILSIASIMNDKNDLSDERIKEIVKKELNVKRMWHN